ncbi:MAG: hypothetical protein IT556_06730, partial [Acetobacteraceae bacterium]|nr:hypothetical protein [Acetobacteraceae bacterium]
MTGLKTWTAAAVLLAGSALSGGASASTLYFDFNRNTIGNTANASLFLFGAANQNATVTTLSGFNQTVTLGANGFFNLPIA